MRRGARRDLPGQRRRGSGDLLPRPADAAGSGPGRLRDPRRPRCRDDRDRRGLPLLRRGGARGHRLHRLPAGTARRGAEPGRSAPLRRGRTRQHAVVVRSRRRHRPARAPREPGRQRERRRRTRRRAGGGGQPGRAASLHRGFPRRPDRDLRPRRRHRSADLLDASPIAAVRRSTGRRRSRSVRTDCISMRPRSSATRSRASPATPAPASSPTSRLWSTARRCRAAASSTDCSSRER